MKYAWMLALAAVVLTGISHAWARDDDDRAVSVQGTATVSAEPDMARVAAGVETAGESADQALAANGEAMRRVMTALTQNGVDGADIQTSGFSIAPDYGRSPPTSSDPPRITGYRVTNQVSVRVRDISRLGALMDVLVREGANRISGVEFLVADETEVKDEARRKAVQDARRKARVLAAEAGIELGRVLRVSEVTEGGPGPRPLTMARAESAVPIAPGTLDFRADVAVTFAIAGR